MRPLRIPPVLLVALAVAASVSANEQDEARLRLAFRRAVVRHADDVRIRFVWCGRKLHPDITKLASLAGEEVTR